MNINDSRSFWETIVPLFSSKNSKRENITLPEKVEMSRTILKGVEFSAIVFQTSLPICEYQL